jgi:hypothetical protein
MSIKIASHMVHILLIASAVAHAGIVRAQLPANGGHNNGTRTSKLAIEKDHGVLLVRDFCIHGMQFVAVVQHKTANSDGSGGVAVAQVNGIDGKPMRCGAAPANPN